jgi:hypothetical protein
LRELRTCGLHACLRLPRGRARRVEIAGGNQLLRAQLLGAAQLGGRVLDLHGSAFNIRLEALHRGLGLLDLRLEQRRLEPREHLPLPHP